MAMFKAQLVGDLDLDLSNYQKRIQSEVLFSGAAGMAAVIAAEVQLNASPPRLGRKTGNLQSAIYQVFSPERSTPDRVVYRVSWNKRKAPHGQLLEFGTSRAPAHPFVRPALAKIGPAIAEGRQRMSVRLAGSK